jgi:hypothetical protein
MLLQLLLLSQFHLPLQLQLQFLLHFLCVPPRPLAVPLAVAVAVAVAVPLAIAIAIAIAVAVAPYGRVLPVATAVGAFASAATNRVSDLRSRRSITSAGE